MNASLKGEFCSKLQKLGQFERYILNFDDVNNFDILNERQIYLKFGTLCMKNSVCGLNLIMARSYCIYEVFLFLFNHFTLSHLNEWNSKSDTFFRKEQTINWKFELITLCIFSHRLMLYTSLNTNHFKYLPRSYGYYLRNHRFSIFMFVFWELIFVALWKMLICTKNWQT